MNYKKYMNRLAEKYKDPYIQIPNRLISDLNNSFKTHGLERYTDYGFSFLVVNGFLYKYAHYVDYEKGDYILLRDIKQMLKYSPNNQNINKISRVNSGVLHYESYVDVTDDIPVTVEYSQGCGKSLNTRNIIRLSEIDWIVSDEIKYNILNNRNHYVYIPEYMLDYPMRSGTLNDYSNTIKISFSELNYFILSEEMTLKDFLVYCFIKSSTTKSGDATISQDRARRGMGISHVTFLKVISNLEERGVIGIEKGKNVNRYRKTPNKIRILPSFLKKMGNKRL